MCGSPSTIVKTVYIGANTRGAVDATETEYSDVFRDIIASTSNFSFWGKGSQKFAYEFRFKSL
jgi:hypothetical protein